MITKAIVQSVSGNSVIVRIPLYNKIGGAYNATPDKELYSATICVPQGQFPQLSRGSVVFVGFEDNEMSKPIILGHLLTAEQFKNDPNRSEMYLSRMEANAEAIFEGEISVLDHNTKEVLVSRNNLLALKGVEDSLKETISNINQALSNLEASIEALGNDASRIDGMVRSAQASIDALAPTLASLQSTQTSHSSKIDEVSSDVSDIQSEISSLKSKVSTAQTDISTLKSTTMTKSVPIVSSTNFGSGTPSSGTSGQLYFVIED